ncbi:type II toxin-antitoxin system HicB family antitoxin [Rhizobium leguminosarum bv. viciae]|uniref:type II toxin-antitoxin system HicB family antitoxin n=1 Tax=Rhizobium leguminosarum TaxID=384 RepID=UPI0014415F45|nr:type II toxin-antitoxin system HicB family antitoxin [Rhizobium leguminosarum]NKJ90563.1 type II toxin-antitoxin system HicB family antitoxin [Rhizobium leguminosarum bv. viciae]
MNEYAVVILPLSAEDGGGFIGLVPDLLGCMSDGETPHEALSNTYEAIAEWIDEANRRGRKIPSPGDASERSKAKMASIRKTLQKIEDVENRLQNLEVSIRELNEQSENIDAWSRFSTLTGFDSNSAEERSTLAC